MLHSGGFSDGESGGTPGQRKPGAAVSVVVNNNFLAKLLATHDETGLAKWPVPDHFTNDVFSRDARCDPGISRIGSRISGRADPGRRTGTNGGSDRRSTNGLQYLSASALSFVIDWLTCSVSLHDPPET
jgi:hypothetical protein